jgi:hypothetical protein
MHKMNEDFAVQRAELEKAPVKAKELEDKVKKIAQAYRK